MRHAESRHSTPNCNSSNHKFSVDFPGFLPAHVATPHPDQAAD